MRCSFKFLLLILPLLFHAVAVYPVEVTRKDNKVRITVNSKGKVLQSISDPRYVQTLKQAIRDLEIDAQGRIWAASWGSGIHVFDQKLRKGRKILSGEVINALNRGMDGFWGAGKGKLFKIEDSLRHHTWDIGTM